MLRPRRPRDPDEFEVPGALDEGVAREVLTTQDAEAREQVLRASLSHWTKGELTESGKSVMPKFASRRPMLRSSAGRTTRAPAGCRACLMPRFVG